MHSYADRRTHDFFFERDYPDVTMLDGYFRQAAAGAARRRAAAQRAAGSGRVFDKALEKLWIHGGAVVDYAENVAAGRTAGANRTCAERAEAAAD